MALWFVFALMTAAAIFAVLWPLGRRGAPQAEGDAVVVYRDQLAEIDRDAAASMIAPQEADAARVEISRRLLAAADARPVAPMQPHTALRRIVAVVALAGLPAIAAAFYLPLGSPKMPDVPLAERKETPSPSEPLDRLVAQVESHLEKNPTDGRGWAVIAPVLSKLGRLDDAVRAWRNAIAYAGDSSERRADLGEAIAAAAGGVITADAKAEFERAVALDGMAAKPRFVLGVAAEQDGRPQDAAAIFRAMLATAPKDAPWKPAVQAALARVGGSAMPIPSEDAVAAASGMTDGDRSTMIHGMIDRLAGKLKDDGSDVEGWLRLVRAYMVLGDADKATSAEADARKALASDADRLKQLNDGLKSLGRDG